MAGEGGCGHACLDEKYIWMKSSMHICLDEEYIWMKSMHICLDEEVEPAVLGGGGNRLHARSALHAVRVVDEVRHVELEADARQVEQPLHAARREARGGREYAEDLPCTLGWTTHARVDHAR